MISRDRLVKQLLSALKRNSIVSILGPRQCGKTTLAGHLLSGPRAVLFDLENPKDTVRLQNPQLTLGRLKGTVIIDEIQRRPDLFPLLRVLADRKPQPAKFVILGSAAPDVVRGVTESLAGRVEFLDIGGFTLDEVGISSANKLWVRGGFPKSFLASNEKASLIWRDDFVRTFLERDIPNLGISIPPETLRRFWVMLAHFHGQIWSGGDISSSLGIAHTTTRRYLDLLTGVFMIRQLPPWHENFGKRIVKMPKVYFRDTGLLHTFLNIQTKDDLGVHPKLGASWEGFCLEQTLRRIGERHVYFWATHNGAELDLMVERHGKKWGIEFKHTEFPTMTKSMHIVLNDLKLEKLWVIYLGEESFSLSDRVDCRGLNALSEIEKELN